MTRRQTPVLPCLAGPLRSGRPSAPCCLGASAAGSQLPDHAAAAQHGAAGGAGRRAAVRTGRQRAGLATPSSGRHAVGHLQLFLKSPWRWPELWGMNLEQIRNPHLIYPGQILFLDKTDGRARLRVGQPVGPDGTVKLSPRVARRALGDGVDPVDPLPPDRALPQRSGDLPGQRTRNGAAHRRPRRKAACCSAAATPPTCAARSAQQREFRIFREPKPLRDPTTKEVLGYEATYVGAAEYVRQGETRTGADGKPEIIPATFSVTSDQAGSRRRRPAGARAAARVQQLRTARAAGPDGRPDRLDLRRGADGRPEPDRRAQQGRGRRRRAWPCAGAVARRRTA